MERPCGVWLGISVGRLANTSRARVRLMKTLPRRKSTVRQAIRRLTNETHPTARALASLFGILFVEARSRRMLNRNRHPLMVVENRPSLSLRPSRVKGSLAMSGSRYLGKNHQEPFVDPATSEPRCSVGSSTGQCSSSLSRLLCCLSVSYAGVS